MKIAINRCYGGFGLSREALRLIAQAKGWGMFQYIQTKYDHRDGVTEYTRVEDNEAEPSFAFTLKKDLGKTFTAFPKNDDGLWFNDRDISRDDADLVRVIETLGTEKASGRCGELHIVEIPDDVKWELEEYDGREWVSETHRTW